MEGAAVVTDYDPDFDFKGNADRLLLAFRLIAESVDVEQMLTVSNYAHAIGPFIDPTAYMGALDRGDMGALEDLCRSLAPALKVWRERIAPKLPEVIA